jgi:small subunit ribosomal protein S11
MAEDTTTLEVVETAVAPAEEAAPVTAAPSPAQTLDTKVSTGKRKKIKRSVPVGHIHILATFNNTIITVTDLKGGVLTFSSAGACGFRGSKKGTAYAAQVAAEKALGEAKQAHGLSKADVFVKGIGMGRDAAIRAMQVAGIAVEGVHDVTGVPHGGVRPKKARRV